MINSADVASHGQTTRTKRAVTARRERAKRAFGLTLVGPKRIWPAGWGLPGPVSLACDGFLRDGPPLWRGRARASEWWQAGAPTRRNHGARLRG